MRTAAATNRVTLPAQSFSQQPAGITVNADIPVGGLETWRREAIQKVIGLSKLAPNWDSRGSEAPTLAVRQTAIELLLGIPGGEWLAAPRVVPISGGGLHFEWAAGDREVEISVEPNCRIEALRVEHGMPIEDESSNELPALFGWLSSR